MNPIPVYFEEASVRFPAAKPPVRKAKTAEARQLPGLKARMASAPAGAVVKCLDYHMRINDGPNYYTLFKDLFVQRIYHFDAIRPDPLVLDCGSNIGMSILYFKHTYPQARVIGFEPDPTIYPLLEENMARNALAGVQLHQAAVGHREGHLTLASDRKCGSCLSDYLVSDGTPRTESFEVPCIRLHDHLVEPVDFLKMNVEGAEWDIVADSESRLRQVRELVIEYHHLPGLPRTLHRILEVLHRQGFEYLVNSFDQETNPGAGPPFRLHPKRVYFLLIYAKRID